MLPLSVRSALRGFARRRWLTLAAILGIGATTGALVALAATVRVLSTVPSTLDRPDQLIALMQEHDRNGSPSALFSYPDLQRLRPLYAGQADLAGVAHLTAALGDNAAERIPIALVSANYFRVLGVHVATGEEFGSVEDSGALARQVILAHPLAVRLFGAAEAAPGRDIVLAGSSFHIVGVAPPSLRGTAFGQEPALWAHLSAQPQLLLAPGPVRAAVKSNELWQTGGWSWFEIVGRLAPIASASDAGAPDGGAPDAGGPAPAADRQTSRTAARLRAAPRDSGERDTARASVREIAHDAARHGPRLPARMSVHALARVPARVDLGGGWSARALPLSASQVPVPFRRDIEALLRLIGLVVSLMCAAGVLNTLLLMLHRARARQRELAVSLAIGATPSRLLTQAIVEGTLLGIPSGAAAMAVAIGVHALVAIALNRPTLLASAGPRDQLVLATLAIGLAIAMAASTSLVATAGMLAARSSGTLQGAGAAVTAAVRTTAPIVTVQFAVSALLTTWAGVLAVDLISRQQRDAGFDAASMLVVRWSDPRISHRTDAAREGQLRRDLLARVRTMDDVGAASFSTWVPFGDAARAADVDQRQTRRPVQLNIVDVSGELVQALGLRLVRGRAFDAADPPGTLIVNDAWTRIDADVTIGAPSRLARDGAIVGAIVGVVRDIDAVAARQEQGPMAYRLADDAHLPAGSALIVRARARPASVTHEIDRFARALDPRRTVAIETMEARRRSADWRARAMAGGAAIICVLAMLISAIGSASLVSHQIAERTREIAIRAALGAQASALIAEPLARGARLALAGTAAGLLAAWLLQRVIAHVDARTGAAEALAYAAGATLNLLVLLLAAYPQARRAATIDPARVLRRD